MSNTELAPVTDIHSLYCAHHGWLYNWLRYRLGCTHRAADLAHDTYLRVINSGRIPSMDQARPYLLQIAKGLVIDGHRRQRLEQAYLETLANQPEALTPSAEESALVLEALVLIDTILAALKPMVRETFLLCRFDGLTYSAIAGRLNISVATVRKYMGVALQACVAATAEQPDILMCDQL